MIALWLGLALAQDTDLDVERFRPHADHFGYTVTESAATLQHLQLGVGLWGHYSQDPLVLVDPFGQRTLGDGTEKGDAVIDQRSVADLQAGLGITRYFSFTANMPVILWQEGWGPANASGTTDLVASGVGDLRLRPKVVALDLDEGPVGLAFVAQVNVPTGGSTSFIGEGTPGAEPLVAFEVADGSVHEREYRIRAAVNLGGRFRAPYQYKDLEVGQELVYRAAVGAHPSAPVELGVELFGSVSGARTAQHHLESAFWFKLLPLPFVTLTGGGGFGILSGVGSPDMRFFVGGTLAPSFDPNELDRDGDGVSNKVDHCINIPEDIDQFEDEDGCPDEDNDRDGILDTVDQCPNDPEDQDGFEDGDGCPDEDNDRDGILDAEDDCPDTPENVNGFQDEDGCPDVIPEGDSDGDGLLDDDDRCPLDPEDRDDFEDDDGCPDPDNDFDGILDPDDDCPLERETNNGFQDEDGCPDEAPSRVVVEKERIRITEKIFFEVDKAEIKVLSYELLEEIATVILDHPEIRKIRVEGHTDADGDETYNLRLSQARAEAVVEFLVNAGVEAERLDPAGFGETRPVADNDTPDGKAQNRRVEFLIVERE